MSCDRSANLYVQKCALDEQKTDDFLVYIKSGFEQCGRGGSALGSPPPSEFENDVIFAVILFTEILNTSVGWSVSCQNLSQGSYFSSGEFKGGKHPDPPRRVCFAGHATVSYASVYYSERVTPPRPKKTV